MTLVTRLPASILSFIYSELFLLSTQPHFSAVPCFAFTPTHAYIGCLTPTLPLPLDNSQVGGCLEGPHSGSFPATESCYLLSFLNGPRYDDAILSKLGIKRHGGGKNTLKAKYRLKSRVWEVRKDLNVIGIWLKPTTLSKLLTAALVKVREKIIIGTLK